MKLEEIKNLTFRTYGTKVIDCEFNYECDEEKRNRLNAVNKPIGLWASPKDSKDFVTWKKFIKENKFKVKSLRKHKDFTLKDDANILMLTSKKEIMRTWRKYKMISPRMNGLRFLDWKRIEEDYDGVFFLYSDWVEDYMSTKFYFYTWDVDSLCIWNLDKIQSKK